MFVLYSSIGSSQTPMLDSQPVKKNILTTYNTANILFRESGWSEFGITRVTGGQELHDDEQSSFFLALSIDLGIQITVVQFPRPAF